MNELVYRGQVEVRQRASDGPLLIMAGLGSMAMVVALAYALLGASDDGWEITGSIVFASKMVLGSLAVTALILLGLLVRPRPFEAEVEADIDGLKLSRAASTKTIPARSIRGMRVILDGARSCVEFERGTGVTRVYVADQDHAERLGGVLAGTGRFPAAIVRVRRRSSYPLFVATVCSWILVYGALTALPLSFWLGLLLVAVTLPLAIWITLRAIPAQILVSAAGLTVRHPLERREIPAAQLASAAVTDDTSVRIRLDSGESVEFHGLADHPLDMFVTTANPPPQRVAEGVNQVVAERSSRSAA